MAVVANDVKGNTPVDDAPLDIANPDALLVVGAETVDAPNKVGKLLEVGAEAEAEDNPNTVAALLEVAEKLEDAANEIDEVFVAAEAEDVPN